MNKRNSILESLSEGMLTTAVAKGKGDVTDFFNDLLKGKVPKDVNVESNITRVYETDSRANKVYKSKVIKSKTVKNLTFNELPNGYVSVVFNELIIKRAMVIHIDMDLEDFIADALTYDTDYIDFMSDIDMNYTVLADVVWDDVQNRLCLTDDDVIKVFLRKYFDINNGTKFTRWFISSNLDSMISNIGGGLIMHPSGKAWIMHMSADVTDINRFSAYVDLFPALSSDFHSTCAVSGDTALFQLRIKD
jgi:hypothetical protein